jgi:serine protease Do
MSFWSNDEFGGLNEPGRKRLRNLYNGGKSNTWNTFATKRIGFLILTPLLLLVVGWLFILPFFLNHANSGGISIMTASAVGKGSSSFNENVILAADRVKPAVVSVINFSKQGEAQDTQGQAEPEQGTQMPEEQMFGLGSGIIFRIEGKKAFVVTNEHVIEGAGTLEVVLTDGERRKAKLIGADRVTDLAVLQMDSKDIQTVAKFGDSDRLKAGESAIAIGNPLGLGYSQTITAGIISVPLRTVPVSLNRDGQMDWEVDLIQTDAAINRGNSGGALVNLDGSVIGINSLKVTDFGVEGLGFAIPSNQAIPIIDSLMEFGKVKRPFIGVSTTDLSSYMGGTETLKLPDDVKQGVIVLEATGPAGEAGMLTGDLIVQLDNRKISTTLELRKYLYLEKKIGDQVEVGFYRESRRGSVIMTLVELKPEE